MTMPAPIPIARGSDALGTGSSNLGGNSFGNSFGSSFLSSSNTDGSASFREAMAMASSFGKDMNMTDLVDYSSFKFGSSVDSEMTIAPSTSFGRGQRDAETDFCRNFECCNIQLNDLHDLLQHYEEAHVRFDDDGGMPGMIEDDGSSSAGSVSTPSSMPPSPRAANARNAKGAADGKRRAVGLNIQDGSSMPSDMDSPSTGKGKKRSFGQYDAGMNSQTGGLANASGSVHQSLRRALIDGGVGGRSNRSSPSIYSANSPFSTPGSSIPGTPLGDDHDFAFSSNGLSAFSSLSLRPLNGEDHLPACAPPNLFFPAAGSSSTAGANATTVGHPALNALPSMSGTSQPPAKRERIGSTAGDKLDKDGQVVDKPFKCPNPGCDKAYKQANGLKYHRLHGSCNKNLSVDGATPPPQQSGSQTSTAKTTSPGAPTASSAAAAAATAAGTTGSKPSTASTPSTKPAQQPSQPKQTAGAVAPNTTHLPKQGTFPGQTASKLPHGQQQQQQQQQSKTAAPANIGGPKANAPNSNASTAPKTNVNTAGSGNGNVKAAPATGPQGANKVGSGAYPLPGNITSAALAAASALLQRGGPIPSSFHGQQGPIDSAALLRTLHMLQTSIAQQQSNGSTGNAQRTGLPGQAANANNLASRPQAPTAGNASGPRPGGPNNNGQAPRPNVAAPGGASRPSPAGVRPSPPSGTPGGASNPVRSGNLTNTQPVNSPAGLSMNKPAAASPGMSNAVPGGISAGTPSASHGTTNTNPKVGTGPSGSTVNPTAAPPKQNNAPSGITPQMLAAAQQAAAQKRAQQAGAQQRPS